MSKFGTFKKLLKNDKRQIIVALYNNIVHTGITNVLSDEFYLKLTYRIRFGKSLDLHHPVTFNQKIQWLKLNDRNPDYIKMVDKVEVKKYVADVIGESYVISTLGVWDSFEEIDFNTLPNQFVLKCNHDSGSIVICKDKRTFNIEKARKKLTKGLNTNSFFWGREWPYKQVKKKILAEAYLEDKTSDELKDYKLMCFNGKVRCSFVCSDRFNGKGLKVTFFDNDWNVLPFERHYPKSDTPIAKPQTFKKMVEFAEILSKDIPFVRVDFYEINGNLYFGELTFSPGSGMEEFTPESADYELGSLIKLPPIIGGVLDRK